MDKPIDIIGIPSGTRLHQIVTIGDVVHVWIAVKNRGHTYADWQGTYIELKPDGQITRVTVDDAYTCDDEFIIRKGQGS